MLSFVLSSLCIGIPVLCYFGFKMQGKKMLTVLGANIFAFFAILAVFTVNIWTGNVLAETAAAAGGEVNGLGLIAAGLSTGLACIGAGIAVAAASSAALGALSEDPTIMGKALIFVALAEGIALYGLLISIQILGKI